MSVSTRCHGAVLLVAALVSGCGGTGGPAVGAMADAAALTCQTGLPFAGAPPHAALPASLFPAPAAIATPPALMPEALGVLLDQQVADLLRLTGAPAVTAAITVPGLGGWRSTQGLAQAVPAQAVNEGTEFYWGSVAKPLTAVIILQLAQEGKLRLDDPLSRWYPQLPQAARITLAQLLAHTSGLQSNVISASGLGAQTPAQQLALLANMPLLFCPGTNVGYSNAGYLMLALVIEAIEQQAFDQSVQDRLATPLGLSHLRALRPGEEVSATLAQPHEGRQPKADPNAWLRLGAGNVVARAEDMVVFWQAVLSGQLLAPATVQSQWALLHALGPPTTASNQNNSWIGQGVMLSEWTDDRGHARTWLGHAGGIPTANAVLLYDPDVQAYAAVAVNSAVSSHAVANALLKTVIDWRARP